MSNEFQSEKNTAPPAARRTEDFLRALLRSQLLDREFVRSFFLQLDPALRCFPIQVAEAFVRAGHLTRFQSGKLLQGISKGLKLGHFAILSPVARGGTATVYLAMNLDKNQLVAVKILPPCHAKEPRRLARFVREMRLSKLAGSHTNIPQVHESGRIESINYIAMDFVSGRSLQKLVSDNGPLSLEQAAFIGMEIALALHHIHLQGLIHRDVKPANIVISSKGQVRLIDFGLSMHEKEPLTEESVVGGPGFIVGTMDYIAPEQTIDPSRVDGRADIYSLGCVLYFALTGKPPFQGGTNVERMRRHRKEEPELLSGLRPDLPKGFLGLIRAMMDKDPGQRIFSAGLLAADLKLWTPGSHVFETVTNHAEFEDMSRLRMYQPDEISDLEKQLLADDTGSEPKSDTFAVMHDPTEMEVAIRDCIDSGSSTHFIGKSNEKMFLDPGQSPGGSTVFFRPKSRLLLQYWKSPGLLPLVFWVLTASFIGFLLWMIFKNPV